MNFLNHLWPWKELNRLREDVEFLKRTLEHEQTSHNLTRASLQDHKLELIDHRVRVAQGQKDVRKLATILAMRSGITILLLFFSFGASGQPILRQLFTTNIPPIISSISGPMITTNGSGKPELTFNGAGLTNITGVAVKQGTNIITTTNGQVVTVNGVTDTNVVDILLVGVSNYVSTVSANATNEALLIGLNGTNANTLLGSNATNNDQFFGLNATNEALLIGLNGTNANTLLGTQATNNDTVVSNGITGRIIKSLGVTVDGGGQVLTSGIKGYLEVPSDCTIISATLMADQAGSVAIETWRTNGTVASFPPTRAGVLFTNYLTSASKSTDFALANATSLSLGVTNVLGFNVITGASSITRLTLQLRVQP